MAIDSIQSSVLESLTSEYSTTTSTEDNDSLGKNEFLKILLAQLQYQDPLNPMDGTDMTSQLAQFSALEQQMNTNDLLEEISAKLDSQSEDNLLDYVGKEVMLWSDVITINEGVVSRTSFATEEDADVEVVIYDSTGSEIKRLNLGYLEAGYHDVGWDGKDSTGETMGDGKYSFEVIATNDAGEDVTAYTAYSGKVTGVTYEYDTPYLLIDDGGLVERDAVVRVLYTDDNDVESGT